MALGIGSIMKLARGGMGPDELAEVLSAAGSAAYTISAAPTYVTSSYATNTTLSAKAVTLSLNCAGGGGSSSNAGMSGNVSITGGGKLQ